MARKKRSPLPPEILAVLRSSPRLEPCQRFQKVRRPTIDKVLEHIRETKCEQCLDFFDELERESKMMVMLRQGRN
jgi:hypothetical protein